MYHCISNSITEEAHLNIVAETQNYTVQGTPLGELLFKFIMQKAVIYTRTMVSCLGETLTNIDTYIATVNYNIQTFNQHVKVNMEGLKARG